MRSTDSSGRSSHVQDQARAHRGEGPIDFLQQRSAASTVRRLNDLEVPERDRIDDHRVGAGSERQITNVRQLGFLRFAQVGHERAGSACRQGGIFESEPAQRLGLHL